MARSTASCSFIVYKFNVVQPDGAFYLFPEAPGGSGTDFVMKAVENNVLVIPGGVFSERDTHFRISYAAPDERLWEGIEILNGLVSLKAVYVSPAP